MKKISLLALLLLLISEIEASGVASQMTIDLARMFSRDIFENNGVKYMQPLVVSVNSTSNSRFFNSAYVPSHVNKPYFKVSINGMIGIVRDDQKYYYPTLPAEQLDPNVLSKYVQIDYGTGKVIAIPDTTALVYYALKTIVYDGLQGGSLKNPERAATILGNEKSWFVMPHGVLDSLIRSNPVFDYLSKELQDTIIKTLWQFPWSYTLPEGANINLLGAGIPQLEIGSLFGTEMLIRFVPPIKMSENIGKFAFWGLGLKHSISQYFYGFEDPGAEDSPFDLAVQAVYQGTHLTNVIGVTNAKLTADATIWDFNIHASKQISDWLDIYTGCSFESIDIISDYLYYLPVETQGDLGLLQRVVDPNDSTELILLPPNPPEYPGDTVPQKSSLHLSDRNFTWVIGAAANIGNFRIFLDFNISKFNIFTGGIEWRF